MNDCCASPGLPVGVADDRVIGKAADVQADGVVRV